MLFLVNEQKKVIFGWSAKCGCSHIKNIFYYFQSGKFCKKGESVHRGHDFQALPENLSSYVLIMFIRNPYKRLVSGFLDKYGTEGEFRNLWLVSSPITFSNFVDKLVNKSKIIDHHHFTPQTSEHFCDLIREHRTTHIFDIDSIDYSLLESIFDEKLPTEVLEYRGEHCYNYRKMESIDVFNIVIDEYHGLKPPLYCFYNGDILKKVENFYKEDFDFFLKKGFKYTVK